MSPRQEVSASADLLSTQSFHRALETAAANAEDVDRRGRFPSEAVDALRAAGALGWAVPREYGGDGAGIDVLSQATFELARRCSATAMVFSMHQIQVASIARHIEGSGWLADYLRRVASEQRLIASATSEAGVGGDLRRSIAAVRPDPAGGFVQFEKKASAISYGAHADDLLTSLRRGPDSEPGDQVLVLTHFSEMEVEQTGEWDTLGMRGTCSPGFTVKSRCRADQILPVPFGAIAAETMVPYSHILWTHAYLGIATDAFTRAQNFVRAQARQKPGTVPPAALRLAELSARMAQFRALVQTATEEYERLADGDGRRELSTVGYAARINNLKIAASDMVAEACQAALRICSFAGYSNCGPYSVTRHLRDATGAALMIANDRLLATNAALLTVYREGK